jgi:hypothetical protein
MKQGNKFIKPFTHSYLRLSSDVTWTETDHSKIHAHFRYIRDLD